MQNIPIEYLNAVVSSHYEGFVRAQRNGQTLEAAPGAKRHWRWHWPHTGGNARPGGVITAN